MSGGASREELRCINPVWWVTTFLLMSVKHVLLFVIISYYLTLDTKITYSTNCLLLLTNQRVRHVNIWANEDAFQYFYVLQTPRADASSVNIIHKNPAHERMLHTHKEARSGIPMQDTYSKWKENCADIS